MKYKKKRITALFVFMFTLFSLIPLNMAATEKKVLAAGETVTNGKTYVFSVEGNVGTPTTDNIDTDNSCQFSEYKKDIFIGVKMGEKASDNELLGLDGYTKKSESIEKQTISLVSINGIPISGDSITQINNVLGKFSSKVTNDGLPNLDSPTDTEFANNIGTRTLEKSGERYRGIVIDNLPFGVNVLRYTITEEKKVAENNTIVTKYPKKTLELTIYHGTSYVSSHVKDVETFSYIDAKSDVYENQVDEQLTNNSTPILYNDFADTDSKTPMIYYMNMPDSTRELKYKLYVSDFITKSDVDIFLNGELKTDSDEVEFSQITDASGTGTAISGTMPSITDPAYLVIHYKSTQSIGGQSVAKTYSILLKPVQSKNEEDFRIKQVDMQKYMYNEDDSVKAYIGKLFSRDKSQNTLTYDGTLYVDPAAQKISINPISCMREDKLVYSYDNSDDVVSKGKYKFIPIPAEGEKVVMNAFAVKDGVVDTSNILVRYVFTVKHISGGDVHPIDIDFNNTAYLTQPGVEGKKDFDSNVYTYNIYADGRVTATLKSPNTTKNEYIRVFLGKSIKSSGTVEATQSVGKKKNEIKDIDLGDNQYMIIKVYYDKSENGVTKAYQIGSEYKFYIAKNISEEDGEGQKSNNAALKDLSIKDGTLKDNSGNKGFVSSTYAYIATVDKDAKNAVIKPVTKTDVHSITATVKETGDEYDMYSGKDTKIPLNSNGTTTVSIKVLAEDKVTTSTYTVVINNSDKSSDCGLKNLIVSPGDYTFDDEKDTTKVRVDIDVRKVDITPIASDGKAKIYIDDDLFKDAAKKIDLSGEQETEVEIEVVSEDGTSRTTHTVIITRRDADSVVSSDDDEDESDVFYDEYEECWVDTSKYDEWGTIKGKDVYFDKRGRQVKDAWITTGKNGDYTYYYLNKKGYKAKGWLTDSTGAMYFLNQETGAMQKGYLNNNGTWFYFEPTNGKMKTGWLYDKQANNWKYFLPTGQMVTNTTMSIEGKVYNFGIDGFIY